MQDVAVRPTDFPSHRIVAHTAQARALFDAQQKPRPDGVDHEHDFTRISLTSSRHRFAAVRSSPEELVGRLHHLASWAACHEAVALHERSWARRHRRLPLCDWVRGQSRTARLMLRLPTLNRQPIGWPASAATPQLIDVIDRTCRAAGQPKRQPKRQPAGWPTLAARLPAAIDLFPAGGDVHRGRGTLRGISWRSRRGWGHLSLDLL